MSALHNLPVELWSHIFKEALKRPTPVLDILEDQERIKYDAHLASNNKHRPHYQYLLREQTRRRLRLVCRAWNAILEGMGERAVYILPDGDKPMQVVPSLNALEMARRIHICFELQCGHGKMVDSCPESCKYETAPLGRSIESVLEPNAHAFHPEELLINAEIDLIRLSGVLDSIKLAKIDGQCLIKTPRISSLINKMRFITHLYLSPVNYRRVSHLPDTLHLDNLLSLTIALGFSRPQAAVQRLKEDPFKGWRLPKLKRLTIDGYWQGNLREYICGFFERVSKTVTELIWTAYWRFDPPNLYQELRTKFPNLAVFGGSHRRFNQMRREMGDIAGGEVSKSFDIVILTGLPGGELPIVHPAVTADGFAADLHALSSNICRIVMNLSWYQYKINLTTKSEDGDEYGSGRKESLQTFLGRLVERGFKVIDIYGIGYDEPEEKNGTTMRQWLDQPAEIQNTGDEIAPS